MRFTPAFLDEVRDRIPIADIVGRRVTFDKRKSNPAKGDYWACCPFHGEKSPSFHCENGKGRYHCFGCGASGDHFRFMTELDGMSFPEAVERLADEAGVPMPAVDPQAMERAKVKATLHDVMQLAVDFFRDQLQSPAGAKARAYLRDRGLSTSIQNRFGLGYAPSSRSALKEFLASKDVPKEQIEACGLVVHGPDIPVSYDRFRDRIMFPILDARERPIAFGGRALSPDVPAKYLNSPETELFSKSNVLYNYARARKALAKDESLIVCEGYMDVIALAAHGFDTAVAPLGTALTEQQMELAWRVGGEPKLCFDGDGAGLRAAFRSVDTALVGLKPGRSLRFALLGEGEDPDDLLKRAGPEAFRTVLDASRPLADMVWMRETEGRMFDTPEKRAELERTMFGAVAQIGDENVKRHYQQDMRERLAGFFGTAHEDELDALDIEHPDLTILQRALLVALADAGERGEAHDVASLASALTKAGHSGLMERLQTQVRCSRIWQVAVDAAFEDARDGWLQALALHTRARSLASELRAAERSFREHGDEQSFEQLVILKAELAAEEGTEALIEGFGVPSGRPSRSF